MDTRVEALVQRAKAAFEKRDYAAALADAHEVLASHPGFADLRHLAGLCYSFLGQSDEALAEFDRALSLNPHYIEAHLNRAITLTDLGRYDEARASFDSATLHETHGGGPFTAGMSALLANAHADVGNLYMQVGAATEAMEQYRRALEMRPEFHDIRNRLAQALIQVGAFDEARAELEHVLDGNPRFIAARLNLGLIHYRLDRLDEARHEWRLCEDIQQDHPQLRAYLTMLESRSGTARQDENDASS